MPTLSIVPEETIDSRIDQIIEYWDFSPLQDEDSRIERLRSEMKALINQQIKSVLNELEKATTHADDIGLVNDTVIVNRLVAVIQKIRSRYE